MNQIVYNQRLLGKMLKIFQEKSKAGVLPGTPQYFQIEKKVITSRPLLKLCYDNWYKKLLDDESTVPSENKGSLLELGSGGSYLKEIRPDIITSDLVRGVADRVIDAREIPFKNSSLRAIFLTHVFHHIPDVEKFLSEADRLLVKGGVISMVEVSHTPLARFVFKRFHPEPFDAKTIKWSFDQKNSMMDANQALSWIVFYRDKRLFNRKFPNLVLENRRYLPWFCYLLSGGVKMKNYTPGFLVPFIKLIEFLLIPLRPFFSLHWHITIRKK
jgi:SAM-dependent methyltransferase